VGGAGSIAVGAIVIRQQRQGLFEIAKTVAARGTVPQNTPLTVPFGTLTCEITTQDTAEGHSREKLANPDERSNR
jgi:hypothetical protein